jgi:sporulation protein YlmC with PRC-barrel domain
MSVDMNETVYLSVDTIKNTRVFDNTGVQIGIIDDLLIDRETNKIACAVLSFGHHLMGIGNKYLAIPLEAFKYGQHEDDYVLDVDKSVLEKEEGFDRNEPLMQTELLKAYTQYKIKPYWKNEG